MFREFWENSSREFEDLGEFIRKSIEEWAKQRKKAAGAGERKEEGGKQ